MARIDAEGFVWIEGRVSDMVNRGGLKVFPAEVEEVLRLAPGRRRRRRGGRARRPARRGALGVRGAGRRRRTPTPAALAEHCRRHLAPYKVPVRFEPVGELPRNEVGKVLKAQLARRAADRAGT